MNSICKAGQRVGIRHQWKKRNIFSKKCKKKFFGVVLVGALFGSDEVRGKHEQGNDDDDGDGAEAMQVGLGFPPFSC